MADTRALIERATAAAAQGDTLAAAGLYEQLAAAEPSEPRWLLKIAEARRSLGDVPRAATAFRAAAVAYSKGGFELRAIAACRVALQLQPNDPDTVVLFKTLAGNPPPPVDAPTPPKVTPPVRPSSPNQAAVAPPVRPSSSNQAAVAPPIRSSSPNQAAAAPPIRPSSPNQAAVPPPPPRPSSSNLAAVSPPARTSLPANTTSPPPVPASPAAASSSKQPAIAAPRAPMDARSAAAVKSAADAFDDLLGFAPEPNVADEAPEVSIEQEEGERRVSQDHLEIAAKMNPPNTPAGKGMVDFNVGAPAASRDSNYEELSLDDSVFQQIPRGSFTQGQTQDAPASMRVALGTAPAEHHQASQAAANTGPSLDASDDLLAQRRSNEPVRPSVDPERLRGMPLLGPLPPEILEHFVRRIEYMTAAPGDRVITEGAIPDDVYLVVRGDLVVTRGTPPRPLARLGEGSFFGEMALLDDTPRSATVVAVTDVELLVLPRGLVLEICEKHPSVLAHLMQALRTRLIATLTNTSPLLSPIPPSERAGIVARFRFREIEPGTAFIREGERSDGLYVILTGRAEVTLNGRKIAALTTGAIAGEMSALSYGKATATVRAVTRVTALVLPTSELHEFIMVYPQVLEHLTSLSESRRGELEGSRADEAFDTRTVRRV